ncbi:MAG TPA: hypothetical protein VF841_10955 [Anaeromyxobacter sp.]
MNGFASAVAAVALLQAEPAPPPAREPAAATAATRAATATPTATPTATATPTPTPTATATPTAAPTSIATRKAAAATPIPTPSRPTAPAPGMSPPAPRSRVDPQAERGEAERVARGFVDALAAGDAGGLAAAASDRFSFDGDTVAGRDAIRSRWSELLGPRAGPPPRVGAIEVLPSADAVARLGKPPARIAPLARPGAWVALADVGGRPVVLFVAREGGRMAVLGMHD